MDGVGMEEEGGEESDSDSCSSDDSISSFNPFGLNDG